MSKHKFEFITLITKDKSYWEYESIEQFLDQEEEELENIIGYFPSRSNVTYDELKEYKNDTNWVVCLDDDAYGSGQTVVTFNSLLDLKLELDNLISRAYKNEYINIYNADDIIYL